MAFLLPSKCRALADQEVYSDFDESEYEEIVAKLTVVQQAIFDKPVKHRHLKNKSVHNRLGKKLLTRTGPDYKEEGNERKYVWQESQWCPGGLTRSQKRRVQRLRNKEMEQA